MFAPAISSSGDRSGSRGDGEQQSLQKQHRAVTENRRLVAGRAEATSTPAEIDAMRTENDEFGTRARRLTRDLSRHVTDRDLALRPDPARHELPDGCLDPPPRRVLELPVEARELRLGNVVDALNHVQDQHLRAKGFGVGFGFA